MNTPPIPIPPEAFDVLIVLIILIGSGFAFRQLRKDFQSPPRFPESPTQPVVEPKRRTQPKR
jgi:hypothetical protein